MTKHTAALESPALTIQDKGDTLAHHRTALQAQRVLTIAQLRDLPPNDPARQAEALRQTLRDLAAGIAQCDVQLHVLRQERTARRAAESPRIKAEFSTTYMARLQTYAEALLAAVEAQQEVHAVFTEAAQALGAAHCLPTLHNDAHVRGHCAAIQRFVIHHQR
jgi:hypothetical protein